MKTNQLITKVMGAALFAAAMILNGSSVFAQVKIGTNPTTIGVNSNLEVEATNNKKVIVNKADGTVVIENTPVGAMTNKLLSVDPVGNVRVRDVPFIPFTAFLSSSAPTVPSLPTGSNAIQIVTLTPDAGYTGYDATSKEWVVPSNGVYTIDYNCAIKIPGANDLPTASGHSFNFQLYTGGIQTDQTPSLLVTNNPYTIFRMSVSIRLAAGQRVGVYAMGREANLTMHGVGFSYAFTTFSVLKVGE